MAETFETHLNALEESVRTLEKGEDSLQKSLEIYEAAVGHLKECHEILAQAEKRMMTVARKDAGQLMEELFEPPEDMPPDE